MHFTNRFYFEALLPEIVAPKFPIRKNKKDIREAGYVTAAIQAKTLGEKKPQKKKAEKTNVQKNECSIYFHHI